VGVITIVEPFGAPCFTKNASVYPVLRRWPAGRKAVGPVWPAEEPLRYTVMLVRSEPVGTSCFGFFLSPMIDTSPLLARKHVSSPPKMKKSITSPKLLPSAVTPVLRSRRKARPCSKAVCQRYCCGTVIAVRLTVVWFALMIPVSTSLLCGRTVRSKAFSTDLRWSSGRRSCSLSTHWRLLRHQSQTPARHR
jgi:hypothetical protein